MYKRLYKVIKMYLSLSLTSAGKLERDKYIYLLVSNVTWFYQRHLFLFLHYIPWRCTVSNTSFKMKRKTIPSLILIQFKVNAFIPFGSSSFPSMIQEKMQIHFLGRILIVMLQKGKGLFNLKTVFKLFYTNRTDDID